MLFMAGRCLPTAAAYRIYYGGCTFYRVQPLFNNEEKKMDHTQELQKALQELRRITGIGLDVQSESEEEA